jgi:lipopolysaccharide export system protein LptC
MSGIGGTTPIGGASAKRRRLAGLGPRHGGATIRVNARYTVFVALMRYALPLVALALFILVVVWPMLTGTEEGFRLTFATADQDESGALMMTNARYVGVDNKDQSYTVTAELATQPAPDSNIIVLDRPQADIRLADGGWLALSAKHGVYYRDKDILDLEGEVNGFSDLGYEFRTESARIDLVKGEASGKQPVEGQGPLGVLAAQGFRVLGEGATFHFNGPVKLVVFTGAPAR